MIHKCSQCLAMEKMQAGYKATAVKVVSQRIASAVELLAESSTKAEACHSGGSILCSLCSIVPYAQFRGLAKKGPICSFTTEMVQTPKV